MSRGAIELTDHTVVITGAASGIGRALALHAAEQRMAVAACDCDAAGLAVLENEIRAAGVQTVVQPVDVSDPAALAAFASEAAQLPPVVLLFANAGVLRSGNVLDMPLTDWRLLIDVNLVGVIATLQAFVPAMRDHGQRAQVVVTGSTGSMVTSPGLTGYCATKHALWPIVEALRDELVETPIGASLLMPGAVSTHIFDAVDPSRPAPADSITPEQAASIAFEGAIADKAKILTHPNYIERAKARFTTVLGELAGDEGG